LVNKIFIGIMASLIAVSLLLFGMLQFFMPMTYERHLNMQLGDNLTELIYELERTPQDQWDNLVAHFVMENSAGVRIELMDGFENDEAFFGTYFITREYPIAAHGFFSSTVSISLSFVYDSAPFQIAVVSGMAATAAEQVSDIFLQMFPYVLLVILVISVVVAFFFSRFLSRIQALQADIQREREHERRRRDFFVAISHELKTPVTILKGELEGMILNVGKFKDRDKYLGEAYKTGESIEKLVSEIMTIAKLDTISLKNEDILLPELTETCVKTYEPLAQAKGIKINRNFNTSAAIQGDKAQIKTVLSNIIGNAVNYSPESNLVDIGIKQENDTIVLSVENTGISIEPQELLKIWEPFYRIDKSRNRNTGGSGLGLYIVRIILDLHGLTYRFEPTKTGMKFIIFFNVTKM